MPSKKSDVLFLYPYTILKIHTCTGAKMYGFSVLTWNSGKQRLRYGRVIHRVLFGGSTGHSAAKLVIPDTEENQKLVAQANTSIDGEAGKGSLKVRNITINGKKCIEIYFSFWGDPRTRSSAEKHRLVDEDTDRIEEGMGAPIEVTPTSEKFFPKDFEQLDAMEWSGLIGSRKAYMGLEYTQDKSQLSDKELYGKPPL